MLCHPEKLAATTSDSGTGVSTRMDPTASSFITDAMGPELSECLPQVVIEQSLEEAIRHQWQQFVAVKRPRSGTESICAWWRETGLKSFKYIAPIARKYLTMLSTSADTERLFSRTKFFCRDEKGRISSQTLNLLVRLSSLLLDPTFDRSLLYRTIEAARRQASPGVHEEPPLTGAAAMMAKAIRCPAASADNLVFYDSDGVYDEQDVAMDELSRVLLQTGNPSETCGPPAVSPVMPPPPSPCLQVAGIVPDLAGPSRLADSAQLASLARDGPDAASEAGSPEHDVA